MSVFIKGISSQAPRQELHKILSKYGNIVRLKTGYQDFAFVDYESDKSAFAAVKALNGTNLLGSRVSVQIAKKNLNNNNNTNERARTLNEDDLLYHRKEELERRPVRNVTEKGRIDERTMKRRDNDLLITSDHRLPRFGQYSRPPNYRGRSRPFSYSHSRGTFRHPPRSYSPHRFMMQPRSMNERQHLRSMSRSLSRSKSRSSSPSSSPSRSRSSSHSRSRSKASSQSRSPRKTPNRELYSPDLSPKPTTTNEPEERVVTRRARSLEPLALRQWSVVNLSRSDTPTDISTNNETKANQMNNNDPAVTDDHALKSGDQKQEHDVHTDKLLDIEQRLKMEEERSAQLALELQSAHTRAEEERVQRSAEDKQHREETERIQMETTRLQRECERLQRECDQLRDEREAARAERDELRTESERARSEHEVYRKQIEAELEHERQLRVTAERALDEERVRHKQTQLHAPQSSPSAASEERVERDNKEKKNKRKATQQLGTKPKRRKKDNSENVDLVLGKSAEPEKSIRPSSSSSSAATPVSLVLDLTDE